MTLRSVLFLSLLLLIACEPIKKPVEADVSKPVAARETNTVEVEEPKLVLDVPAIVGKTKKEVAALLGKVDRCEPS